MKKLIIIILCIVNCALCIASKAISDDAKFYLVTCEPGDAIYERFGHSGIRVSDPATGIDEVFHWGLFSFDTPNFIGRFLSGNTDYEMGVYSTQFFMLQYVERGSTIHAQELDLSPTQKQEFWAKLWTNYRPENRKYRYNFIYNNCATRPYQLILSAYDYKVSLSGELNATTYRDIINRYVPVGTPFNTGINLIIGSRADKNITTKESVAFPMYTLEALNRTHYIDHNATPHPIVVQSTTLNRAPHKTFEATPFTYYSAIIIPLIAALFFIAYTFKKRRYMPIFSHIMLILSALVGIVIFFLWFCSHHPLVDDNINLLWCNPLNLVLAILLCIHKKSLRTTKIILSTLSLFLCIAFLIALIAGIQTTTPQIFSLWVLITIINSTILYTYKKKIKKLIHKR